MAFSVSGDPFSEGAVDTVYCTEAGCLSKCWRLYVLGDRTGQGLHVPRLFHPAEVGEVIYVTSSKTNLLSQKGKGAF